MRKGLLLWVARDLRRSVLVFRLIVGVGLVVLAVQWGGWALLVGVVVAVVAFGSGVVGAAVAMGLESER